jgi:hypothetical protein
VSRHSYHPSLKLQPLQLDLDTTKVEEEILQIHLLDRKSKGKYIDKLKIQKFLQNKVLVKHVDHSKRKLLSLQIYIIFFCFYQ